MCNKKKIFNFNKNLNNDDCDDSRNSKRNTIKYSFANNSQTNFMKGIRTHLLTTFGHSHLNCKRSEKIYAQVSQQRQDKKFFHRSTKKAKAEFKSVRAHFLTVNLA